MTSPPVGTPARMVFLTFTTLVSVIALTVRSENRRPVHPLI